MRTPREDAPARLLHGRNVLITGAGPNIGRAIALEMGTAGADIYFTDDRSRPLRHLERELRDRGVSARGFRSDVTREKDTRLLLRALEDRGVRIDTLVNNVGIQREKGLLAGSDADWRETLLANVLGPMRLTRLVAKGWSPRASAGARSCS